MVLGRNLRHIMPIAQTIGIIGTLLIALFFSRRAVGRHRN